MTGVDLNNYMPCNLDLILVHHTDFESGLNHGADAHICGVQHLYASATSGSTTPACAYERIAMQRWISMPCRTSARGAAEEVWRLTHAERGG